MRRTPLTILAAAAATIPLAVAGLAAPASAQTAESAAKPFVGGLVTPLSLAVTPKGTVYVSQNFAGSLVKRAPGKKAKVVYTAKKPARTEVGAVSVKGGVVTFATTRGATGKVWTLKKGDVKELASTSAYESSANPDGETVYGFADAPEECLAQLPEFLHPYTGIVETHPYASTKIGTTTYVADAAGNAILAIAPDGTVSTAAVMPRVGVEITEEMATTLELPECTVGETVYLENVPTDVEVGPDGNLYVTSLPGGPEDGSLGANGGVYQVNVGTGTVNQYVGGLVSPTGLAIEPNGTAYVTSLFGGFVIKQTLGGEPEMFSEIALPGDIEVSGDYLYVTATDLFNDGSTPPRGKVLRWSVNG